MADFKFKRPSPHIGIIMTLIVDPGPVTVVAIVVLMLSLVLQSRLKRKKIRSTPLGQAINANYFDLKTEEGLADCPFKPGGSLKMGLKKINWQEWLLIDKNLGSVLEDKRKCMKQFDLIKATPRATEAVHELYDAVLQYLCTKYPQYYKRDGPCVNAAVAGKLPYPAASSSLSPEHLLVVLAENVQEDFLLLELDEDDQEYRLRAGSFVYPAGFDPLKLIDLKLSEIHVPVPGYTDKLELPMNRIFKSIKTGALMERRNWSCQVGANLCKPNVNTSLKSKEGFVQENRRIDSEDIYVRSERQCLMRLPRTRFVVFSVRTYLWRLEEIKARGQSELLADSIELLEPEMAVYKGRQLWGESAVEYLSR